MRRLGLLALITTLAACARSQESRIQFSLQGDVETLRPLLAVTATSGDWSLALSGADIGSSATPDLSAAYLTPATGTLTVSAVLVRSGEPPLAGGSVQLDLRRGWSWLVRISLSNRNPADLCFGCLGSQAFPVPAGTTSQPDDSLYIVWGGNWVSHPVIY